MNLQQIKNNYTGSCRADINTLEMCQQSGLFELASGHEAAHGIIFKKENLEKIKEYFQKECINQEKYKIPVVLENSPVTLPATYLIFRFGLERLSLTPIASPTVQAIPSSLTRVFT